MTLEAAFLQELNAHGLNPRTVVADGEFHRFMGIKKNKKAGFYKLLPNGYGVFGDWSQSLTIRYSNKKSELMSAADRLALEREFKDAQKKLKTQHETVAAQVAALFDSLPAAPETHPYLVRKGIKPHIARLHDGRLVLPVGDAERLWSVEYIDANGNKLFHKGGKKSGCYAIIPGDTATVYIAEGFSTAASVHEATGGETVIAYDAGNLIKVAAAVKRLYPQSYIIIAGDNDHKSDTNAGKQAAETAAAKIRAEARLPHGINGTDWNDAAAEFGLPFVRDALFVEPAQQLIVANQPHRSSGLNLELDHNGKPLGTIENLKAICADRGFHIRYNQIAKTEEILIRNANYSVDNILNATLGDVISECTREGMSTANVQMYLTNIADKNPYNPVTEWIESKPWDGIDRLPDLYATLMATHDNDTKALKIRKWLLSAVAAAYTDTGISAHGMLVLQGAQGIGKTQWFKRLAPGLSKDGMSLRLDDKDSRYQCLSHWLVELGELDATFRKSDIAQLKSFLTEDRDILRLPYARRQSTFPRRTVFFASVNHEQFLHDTTGNRRFWVIACCSINHNHTIDMQQLWAQVAALYKSGERWTMTAEEIEKITSENEQFEAIDAVAERVASHYDWDHYDPNIFAEFDNNWLTSSDIARAIGILNPTNADAQRVAVAVKKFNGHVLRRHGKKQTRQLLVPYARAK